MDWFEAIPKVELHVHLEGAIPLEGLWELVQKYDGDPGVPDLAALENRFTYHDFSHFIETWSWKNRFLREYDDFAFIAELVARDFASQNIRYTEMFFSPSLFVRHGLTVQRITEAVFAGLSQVPEIEVALVADLVRDFSPEVEAPILEQLAEVKNSGIVGIGMGGTESEYPPEPFQALFERARKLGFRTNAHAGEAAGVESVWGTIRSLHVDRIGHGTNALRDKSLLNYLAVSHTPIEMCPVSNVRTGVVDCLVNHPIRGCFLHGIPVSVNTDDPKMFHTSLAEEYRQLVFECGFSKREICEILFLTIDASWLPDDRKQALTESFKADDAWIHCPQVEKRSTHDDPTATLV